MNQGKHGRDCGLEEREFEMMYFFSLWNIKNELNKMWHQIRRFQERMRRVVDENMETLYLCLM